MFSCSACHLSPVSAIKSTQSLGVEFFCVTNISFVSDWVATLMVLLTRFNNLHLGVTQGKDTLYHLTLDVFIDLLND